MSNITKIELLDMLAHQDPNVYTTEITKDGVRVDQLTEDKRIDIPTLINLLNHKLTLVFMLNFTSAISCGTVRPEAFHYAGSNFSLEYSEDEATAINAIKACLLKVK